MTTIGRSIVIVGDVTSNEDLQIDGRVRGQVLVREATLVVGPQGHVDAEVRGDRVVIQGHVKGGVTAATRIELAASASVTGSLSANQVVLIDGSQFHGSIDMGQRTLAAKVAQFKAGQAAETAKG